MSRVYQKNFRSPPTTTCHSIKKSGSFQISHHPPSLEIEEILRSRPAKFLPMYDLCPYVCAFAHYSPDISHRLKPSGNLDCTLPMQLYHNYLVSQHINPHNAIADCQTSFRTRVVCKYLNKNIQEIPDDVCAKCNLPHKYVHHKRELLQASKTWLQPVDKNRSHLTTVEVFIVAGNRRSLHYY